ncbi:MAG: DUF6531 domain-containing protein, partial [Rothia sp. (in: high G+C Gram-positive bacteria)]|nr:DUF6531 domain-containing protein [Rothia sp. (in: high G+C Gram-positive bacteria)]
MADELGAIGGDVDFNFDHAQSLHTALNDAAGILENQAGSRAQLVNSAKEEFQGYFSELFSSNAETAASDSGEIAAALRVTAGLVQELIDQAHAENERRRIARDFVAEQKRLDETWGVGKDIWESIFGEPDPPVGPASEPMSKAAASPAQTPRQTPEPGQGSGAGGVSSAIPENLRTFSNGLEPLDQDVTAKKTSLDTAYSDFQGSCTYGSLDAAGVLDALTRWLTANQQDAQWAGIIAQAFEDAGSRSGAPVALSDSSLLVALSSAGVSAAREDLAVVSPSAVGGQPTTGYTLDPVNTGNGNFIEPETDLGFSGASSALAFKRMYNSMGDTGGVFGPGWSSVLDTSLSLDAEGATWAMEDGRKLFFARQGAGFAPCADENFWLQRFEFALGVHVPEPIADQVVWVVSNQSGSAWFFDVSGLWLGSSAGQGQGIYALYVQRGLAGVVGEGSRIASLHHELGRQIDIEYLGGKVAVIRGSDGRRVEFTYNDAGLLEEAKGAGYLRRYGYNAQGLIETVSDAAGVVEVHNTYDRYGRVVYQKTPFGREVRFSYLPGRVTVVADQHDGTRSNSWVSDARGRLIAVIDAHDQRQSMTYDAKGNLLSVTERDGAVTVHAYDQRGRRIRTVTPEGADISYRWDDYDRLLDMVNPHGGLISYEYQGASRRPCRIKDALGGVTELEWQAGLLQRVIGPTGVTVRFEYNQFGELLAVVNAYGDRARFVYDHAGRVLEAISPSGAVTRYGYDAAGNVVLCTDPEGARTAYEYDGANRCVAIVDPAGARTELRYGVHGELVETIDPLGRSVSRVFDDMGNVVAAVLPDGARWGFEHDELSRLVAVLDPAGGRWGREYSPTGQLTATVDPLGNRVSASLDRENQRVKLSDVFGSATVTTDLYGRVTRVEGIDGAAQLVSYDAAGNPVEWVDGQGALTRYVYDRAGKLSTVIYPDGLQETFTYDEAGRPVTYTDPAGGVTQLVYDADSRVVGKVNPVGESSEYTYDRCGRLKSAREPGRGLSRFGYDACGRVTFVQDGRCGTRRCSYDAAGQLVLSVNGLGGRTRYEYDARGRAVRIVDPAGGVTVRTYTQLDKVDSQVDPLGRVTSATYDAAGRLVSQTDPEGHTRRWAYDEQGRETATWLDGVLLSSIERDFYNRKVRISDYALTGSEGGQPTVHELCYDAAGRLVSRSRGQQKLTWVYDAAGRLVERAGSDGGRQAHRYDAAGRLAQVKDQTGGSITYRYDAASRVVSAATEGLVASWVYTDGAVSEHRFSTGEGEALHQSRVAYDELGRVLSVQQSHSERGESQVSYEYDAASQLVAVLPSAASDRSACRYEYDEAGRLVFALSATGVERRFDYDVAGQLTRVSSSSGGRTEFVYDGLGRRVRQVDAAGAVKEFAYDGYGFLHGLALHGADGALLADHSIETDALGEIAAIDGVSLFWDTGALAPTLVSLGGAPVELGLSDHWRSARSFQEADPFALADSAPAADGGFAAGFSLSADGVPVVAGLELMGARAYDPGTASFVSVDPLPPVTGAAWAAAPYSYAGNNPVNQVDPWGLRPATDADLQAYKDANQGMLAAAGDWVAENWEYIAAGAMIVAGGVLIATGVGGPVGGMLVSGGVSMAMQKATNGSVDPVQLAMDMVPGGPVVQFLAGTGSAVYSYMKSPGPHNASALVGDIVVAGLGAALPGPSSAGKDLVGKGAREGAASMPHLSTQTVDYLNGAGRTTGMGMLDDIPPAPRNPRDLAIVQSSSHTPNALSWEGRRVGRTEAQNLDVQRRAAEAYA